MLYKASGYSFAIYFLQLFVAVQPSHCEIDIPTVYDVNSLTSNIDELWNEQTLGLVPPGTNTFYIHGGVIAYETSSPVTSLVSQLSTEYVGGIPVHPLVIIETTNSTPRVRIWMGRNGGLIHTGLTGKGGHI